MSRSPDSESTATSTGSSSGTQIRNSSSPSSSISILEKRSPVMFASKSMSPVSDIIRKGTSSAFPSYPIVIPTIRRAPPSSRSPDSRRSRSPVPSCVPVITTGRRASSPAGIPSSSSSGLRRCKSPVECVSSPVDIHPAHATYDTRDSPSPSGRTLTGSTSTADGCSNTGTPSVTDSRQLKFGMERILSEEMSPVIRRHQHQDTMLLAPNVPCSECVSSLLRCCRLSAPGCESTSGFCSPYSTGYYTTLHNPRPVRPYTNMLAADGVHMSTPDRGGVPVGGGGTNKRKRSWSRAVFSNLQRKGLEKRFQLQKYITKPDRRQLAATLGLTDAQVKVWFQNRRMKWRHSKEAKHQQSGTNSSENRCTREEQGGPDSTQEPEIDIQTVDS